MWPGQVPLETTGVQAVANDGTSISTAQSVQLLYLLMVLCSCGKATLKIFTVFAISRGTATSIHKGRVRVGFWVGSCRAGSPGNVYTGWYSVSRIFIEEVPKAQP